MERRGDETRERTSEKVDERRTKGRRKGLDKVRVDEGKWKERQDEREVRRDEWSEVGSLRKRRGEEKIDRRWGVEGERKEKNAQCRNDVEKGRRKGGEGKM